MVVKEEISLDNFYISSFASALHLLLKIVATYSNSKLQNSNFKIVFSKVGISLFWVIYSISTLAFWILLITAGR